MLQCFRAGGCFHCSYPVITVCIQTSYKLRRCIITSFTRRCAAPGLAWNTNHIKECHGIQNPQHGATFGFRVLFNPKEQAVTAINLHLNSAGATSSCPLPSSASDITN